MLRIEGLSGGYAGTDVLRGVSLELDQREVVVVLGRNGMGKTTLMKAIMGLLPSSRGSVRLGEDELVGLPTHRRARLGIGYVPQGRGVFPDVSVERNLRYGFGIGQLPMEGEVPDRIFEMFPWLRERLDQRAGTLSGGEQQMLAIARALVSSPRLLLLDEPTEGLAPAIVEQLRDAIAVIASSGEHSILLVEQNLRFALSLASRGYVLEKGAIVEAGDRERLQDESIITRHLAV